MYLITYILVLITVAVTQIAAQSSCPEEQTVTLGKQGKIVCNIPNLQGHRTWMIGLQNQDKLLPLTPKDYEVEPDGVFIKVVNKNHTGASLFFEITHPVTGNTILTKTIKIIVYSAPEIHALVQSLDLDGSDTVGCTATGNPRPTIKWVHKLNVGKVVFQETIKHTDFVSTSFINIKESGVGSYQCVATNEIGSALDNVLVYSGKNKTATPNEQELLLGIHDVNVIGVTDSTATFAIIMKNYSDATHIYYLYSDLGNPTAEHHSGSFLIQVNKSYTLSGFPKGSSFTIHFAAAKLGEVGWASTKGLRIDLLPAAPEVIIQQETDDFVLIQWQDESTTVDFYEIQHTKMEGNYLGLLLTTPKAPCTINVIVPACADNTYKLYKQPHDMLYSLIKVRAHNDGGYSDWKQLPANLKNNHLH